MPCSPKQKRALAKARKKWSGMSKKARKAAMPNRSRKRRR
jgi:hypothetical protein